MSVSDPLTIASASPGTVSDESAPQTRIKDIIPSDIGDPLSQQKLSDNRQDKNLVDTLVKTPNSSEHNLLSGITTVICKHPDSHTQNEPLVVDMNDSQEEGSAAPHARKTVRARSHRNRWTKRNEEEDDTTLSATEYTDIKEDSKSVVDQMIALDNIRRYIDATYWFVIFLVSLGGITSIIALALQNQGWSKMQVIVASIIIGVIHIIVTAFMALARIFSPTKKHIMLVSEWYVLLNLSIVVGALYAGSVLTLSLLVIIAEANNSNARS